MDKKPLIVVCICAVFLLFLASLTHVVGYQTVQSSKPRLILEQLQKERIQSSNSECDCEYSMGVTAWQFPFICAFLGALGVFLILLMWSTDIGDNLLNKVLILYALFNCG